MVDSVREQWEANAQSFTTLISNQGTPHHREILNPCVEQLIGNVEGKKLLDAGCGEGYLSRYYSKKGAIVTGIDISNKLIEKCIEITKNEGINSDFKVGDICNLTGISKSEYDLVLCNLVLLNIPCLNDALKEFHRVLRDDGELVFSIVHPAFNFYGPGQWEMGEKSPETKRREGLFFKVDNYFDEKEYQRYWRTREGTRFPQPISFFHRTLSSYFDSLHKSGFTLVNFQEPLPVTDSDFFDRERRVPFFAVFNARKS
ncbi:MAG: methyltransferase domain-containing protein [Candidatus Thorarchaeota archaeon]